MGVNPSSVLFIAVGRNEVRFPALTYGCHRCHPPGAARHGGIKGPKTHRLGRLGKEIQLVWNGVAVSSKLLAENPQLVERFLRGWQRAASLREGIREDTVALISKRDPSPMDAIKVDYDVTKASMTEDGSLPDDVSERRGRDARRADESRCCQSAESVGVIRLQHYEKKLRPTKSSRLAAGPMKTNETRRKNRHRHGLQRRIRFGHRARICRRRLRRRLRGFQTGDAERRRKKCGKKAGVALAIAIDLRKRQEIEAMVKQVVDAFGRIDILVNPRWRRTTRSF